MNKFSSHWFQQKMTSVLSFHTHLENVQVLSLCMKWLITCTINHYVPSLGAHNRRRTLTWISQLFTDNNCICVVPYVIAHSSPYSIVTYFHSSFAWCGTIHEAHTSGYANSCNFITLCLTTTLRPVSTHIHLYACTSLHTCSQHTCMQQATH